MTRRDWLSRKQVEHIKRVSDKDHVWDASSMDNLEYEETQALCSMALAYLDAQEWRPIETAPKKDKLMLWWPDQDEAYKGYWMASASGNGGFWVADGQTPMGKPTLWLPLPQPPKEKP